MIADKPYIFTKRFSTKLSPKIPDLTAANVVDKINSQTCPSSYIGQSAQNFYNCIYNHKTDIRNKKSSTALPKQYET